nr:hypothetical protein [Deltaproteobacteria bacterium]
MFDPDPSHDEARRALGLLGVMTDRCCFFDPFHEAPDVAEVRSCLRKILNHQHARALGHRPAAEVSWLLCGGRPDTALGSLPFAPSTGWPQGFYDLGAALPLSIVVLAELPETADTLALRLMGAGLTLRRAISDLQQTPPGAVRDALVRRVVELHHDRRAHGTRAPEDEMSSRGHCPLSRNSNAAAAPRARCSRSFASSSVAFTARSPPPNATPSTNTSITSASRPSTPRSTSTPPRSKRGSPAA